MCLLRIYLIIGQAAWLPGQLKIHFVTQVIIWKHFALFLEKTHVTDMPKQFVCHREGGQRGLLPKPSVKHAVLMIWKEVLPFPWWQHICCLPWPRWAVTGLEWLSFHPQSLSAPQAAELVSLSDTLRGARKEGHGRNEGFKDDRSNTKKRDGNCWRNHQLCTTGILFKSCLLIVPKRKKSGSSVKKKKSKSISKQTNKTGSRNSSLEISTVQDPLGVTTEVRENLLTVNSDVSTSDSHCWCWLRYCERNITLLSFEICTGNGYFSCKMFFQWRR